MAEEKVVKQQKSVNDPNSKLTLKHRLAYGSGDAGGVVTLVLIQTFMNRYVTNVLGVSFATLSVLLLVWNIWDMVNDPMMGTIMDKSFSKVHGKKDKFRPWMLRSIPLIVIGLIAFFSVPSMFEGTMRLVAIFLLKVIYELGYTMMNIAMGSILGVMALDDRERTTLSSARGMGSTVGGLISSMVVPIILARLGENTTGYMVAGIFAAALGGLLIFFHYWGTEERNVTAKLAAEEQAEPTKVTDIFVTLAKNKAFLSLCLHSIVIVFGQNLFNATLPYIYGDVFGDIGLMGSAALIGQGLPVVLLLIAPSLVKLIGSTVKVIRTYLLLSIVIFVGLYVWKYFGDLPPFFYMVFASIGIAFMMMSVQIQWGLVSESIDYNEYITGKRSEGSIYGNFSLTRRVGQMMAQSLVVLMISWVGYSQEAAQAGQAQSAQAVEGLVAMNLIGPAICALLSWASFKFIWNITDETRVEMTAARQARLDEFAKKQAE